MKKTQQLQDEEFAFTQELEVKQDQLLASHVRRNQLLAITRKEKQFMNKSAIEIKLEMKECK